MPAKTDRSERIAAAVLRSKTEYQPQHAYTEREDAFLPWAAESAGNSKYALEYLVTRALGRDGAAEGQWTESEVLDLVCSRADKSKPQGGLSREVLDGAVRLAVKRRDGRAGELADLSKGVWKAPHVGIALGAAEAYISVSRSRDAVEPLLQASIAGLHYPILACLSSVLHTELSNPSTDLGTAKAQVAAFKSIVDGQRDRLAFSSELFPLTSSASRTVTHPGHREAHEDPRQESSLSQMADIQIGADVASELPAEGLAVSIPQLKEANDIDIPALALALGVQEGLVRSVMARLTKHTGGTGQEEGKERAERGVREL